MKVMTVVGTRPEVIRLSRVMVLLDQFVDHKIIHTGQNYDYELNEIFYDDLEIRHPDHFLNVNTSSLGSTVGDIISKSEAILKMEKPDALLVLGDTNSCLSAYMAKRMHIPIYHMEAGNRCFDERTPEETNRKIIDHISDFNLVYTEHARRHLLSEGLPHHRIYLTGSPLKEVLDHYGGKIDNSTILDTMGLSKQNYFLASIHREENVDNKENLAKIIQILNRLTNIYSLPIIVSTHPRTKKRLAEHEVLPDKNIRFMKPFSFTDYVKLQKNALCVISDSGTISEDCAILNFPAISLRNSFERPESRDSGAIILTGLNPTSVLRSIEVTIREPMKNNTPEGYNITNTSWRVLKILLGT